MDAFDFNEMIEAFFKAPGYHIGLEFVLGIMVLWLVFHKSYKPERTELTEKEKEQLIDDWEPDPLVPNQTELLYPVARTRTVRGKVGHHILVNDRKCLNMGTHNFLGLIDHPRLEEAAIHCLKKYGVGSCGPRGFYGTVDIHLELEQKLAHFMSVEEAVLYSYGFSTMSSAIPAYSKQGDVIFCDAGVNFSIQKGLVASRSCYRFFKHNDVGDLEMLLQEQAEIDKSNPKKARVTRRFLVVEGIYVNYGDICPLPELIELKNRYRVRLFVDESCSFGVLGETGRGVTEHFNIPVDEVDLITGSLEGAIPSYGGFCCGSSFVVDHMRLSGLGYCFSASLPPFQAGVAIAALDILSSNPTLISNLRTNCQRVHDILSRFPQFVLCGDELSPIKHLAIANPFSAITTEFTLKIFEMVVEIVLTKGVALTISHYLEKEEHKLPPPSIRITVSAALTEEDIDTFHKAMTWACHKVFPS